MSFIEDLFQGKRYQEVVMKKLNELFNIELTQNPTRKGVDLISYNGITCEVKFDRLMKGTGNVFIEFECNKLPSGIFKYDFIHLFAYGNDEYFYLFSGTQLKNKITTFINDKKYRIIKAGDGFRTRGILIPESELIAKGIAVRKVYLK